MKININHEGLRYNYIEVTNFKVSFIFTDKKSDFTILKVTNV